MRNYMQQDDCDFSKDYISTLYTNYAALANKLIKQKCWMWKSNMLTVVRQKEFSKNTPTKSEHPQILAQSKAQLPGLHHIITQWKIQTYKLPKQVNQSQLALESGIDDRGTIIKNLEQRVDFLENKLVILSQKHSQICSMLYREIEKKSSFEYTLRKENQELNKMLKVVMEQAKKLLSQLYNKDEARRGSEMKIIHNLIAEGNKQNMNRINLYNSNKLSGNNLLHERKRSRSRKMKLFSNRTKSRTVFSHDESDCQQGANKRSKELKINEIQRNYYKSNPKNEINHEGKSKNHKNMVLLENYTNESPIKVIYQANHK